jgi:hypothetical protein
MLLIGSRATKYHYPFTRKAMDYDFIATRAEVTAFLVNAIHSYKLISDNDKKVRIKMMLDKPTIFEFELVSGYPSSNLIFNVKHNSSHYDKLLKWNYFVASPEILFLLKRSHICFNVHWKKNIHDYLFLKSKVDMTSLPKEWWDAYNMRFEEVKARLNYKELNFDQTNSDFFKKSERAVKRFLPHDNIHYATCFLDKPLFMTVKDDLSKAIMSEEKVNALSHNMKIKLIQEETIALSIERYILPAVRRNEQYNAREAYTNTACRMVYNYLPMFLRLFAADNFMEILDLKINYVKKFFENVKDLDAEKDLFLQTIA